jgi:hypothetical protein
MDLLYKSNLNMDWNTRAFFGFVLVFLKTSNNLLKQ